MELIVTIEPMGIGILLRYLREGQGVGLARIGIGQWEEGPDAHCAIRGGLIPGSGMGLGYSNISFGIIFGGNVKVNDNAKVFIRVEVSYSSLRGQIQSVSGTSNLLMMQHYVCKYNNNSDALHLELNTDRGADPLQIDQWYSFVVSGPYWRRRPRLSQVQQHQRRWRHDSTQALQWML